MPELILDLPVRATESKIVHAVRITSVESEEEDREANPSSSYMGMLDNVKNALRIYIVCRVGIGQGWLVRTFLRRQLKITSAASISL